MNKLLHFYGTRNQFLSVLEEVSKMERPTVFDEMLDGSEELERGLSVVHHTHRYRDD